MKPVGRNSSVEIILGIPYFELLVNYNLNREVLPRWLGLQKKTKKSDNAYK